MSQDGAKIEECQEIVISGILTSNRFPQKGVTGRGQNRGVWLEVDRLNPKGTYSRENCVLSCYFCNNDKSDVFSSREYKLFFQNRANFMRSLLTTSDSNLIDEVQVYSKIGMALISAQRVEFITGQLLNYLMEFDKELHGVTSQEFLANTSNSKKLRMTLGGIFRSLKLTPGLVVEKELDEYLKKRNLLVHGAWETYLHTKSLEQARKITDFCNEFGRLSVQMERHFKGLSYFLALQLTKDEKLISPEMKSWKQDFDYFMSKTDIT